ncbi:thioredoxin family protein [Lacticaseibacillus jixiensis]|uniref:thioredoxin family protein n=1 Tax=Lacticaseibacillus jixiensis TaxID=3231926 RepID=UPI0036F19C09
MVKAVTKQTLAKATQDGITVLELWAPWCGPCKIMGPIMADLEQELPITLVKMNIDEDASVAAQFGIQSIPALVVYHEGKPYEKIIGAYPKAKIKAHLEQSICKMNS